MRESHALPNDQAVVVMGKMPVPGRVKTRLNLPGDVAAGLYTAFLLDVFARVEIAAPTSVWRFACAVEPGDRLEDMNSVLPANWTIFAQRGDELGARMRHAWSSGRAQKTIVLGSDIPTFNPDRILEAFDGLNHYEAVFLPTEDGGYALFGLKQDYPELFRDIEWSTTKVMQSTLSKAYEQGLSIKLLPEHYDIDTPDDLARLRKVLSPDSHTARALSRYSPFIPASVT